MYIQPFQGKPPQSLICSLTTELFWPRAYGNRHHVRRAHQQSSQWKLRDGRCRFARYKRTNLQNHVLYLFDGIISFWIRDLEKLKDT